MSEKNDIDYIDLYLHGNTIDDNILTQPLELFFQEIEISIETQQNEVWGIKDSINLSRYLFNKYVTLTQIKNEITTYLNKNCQHACYFPYTISAETLKNKNGSDLIYIIVTVTAEDEDGNEIAYKQKFLIGS